MRTFAAAAALLCSLAASTAALAAPAAPAKISDADRATYAALLKAGRGLQAAKKYPEAIAKFQAAVKAVPDDPVALGELGWTEYLAKDLVKAEADTRAALAGQGAPAVRGAVLYNLGLILEANSDKPGAIAAYRESLSVRPNGVVRAALTKLDPTAASAFDPFHPVPMLGPFATVDAYCKSKPAPPDGALACSCGKPATVAAAGAPFAQVVTVTYGCVSPPPQVTEPFGFDIYSVAVRTAAGWYVTELANQYFNHRANEDFTFGDATVRTVGGAATLAIAFKANGDGVSGDYSATWAQDGIVVLGVGASKVPSATPPILVHRSETHDWFDGRKQSVAYAIALALAWAKDGVTVTGQTTGLDKGEATNQLGTHALAFP